MIPPRDRDTMPQERVPVSEVCKYGKLDKGHHTSDEDTIEELKKALDV